MIESDNKIIFWVYETKPIKKIKYKMIVENPIQSLSVKYPYFLGEEEFSKSIKNRKNAYRIIGLEELEKPIELTELKNVYHLNAPQNFIYMNKYIHLNNRLKKEPTKILF